MNKCLKCQAGTNPNNVDAREGDIIYINQDKFVYLRGKEKQNIPYDKIYLDIKNQIRKAGTTLKCFKIPLSIELSDVDTLPGDIIYRSGDPFIYIHHQTKGNKKIYKSFEKTHYN